MGAAKNVPQLRKIAAQFPPCHGEGLKLTLLDSAQVIIIIIFLFVNLVDHI